MHQRIPHTGKQAVEGTEKAVLLVKPWLVCVRAASPIKIHANLISV
jgi:hypothetical protein